MTVAELIVALQDYPPDATVVVDTPDAFCEVMPHPTLYRTGITYASQHNDDVVSTLVNDYRPVLVLKVSDP